MVVPPLTVTEERFHEPADVSIEMVSWLDYFRLSVEFYAGERLSTAHAPRAIFNSPDVFRVPRASHCCDRHRLIRLLCCIRCYCRFSAPVINENRLSAAVVGVRT